MKIITKLSNDDINCRALDTDLIYDLHIDKTNDNTTTFTMGYDTTEVGLPVGYPFPVISTFFFGRLTARDVYVGGCAKPSEECAEGDEIEFDVLLTPEEKIQLLIKLLHS